MTFQRTPWAIGGGARIEPEVMRLLAYAATAKTEGVIDIGDLRVRALNVAGGSVLVGGGGAVIKNRSVGGTAQSYIARNDGDVQVNVGPTGGAARSDLLIVRIVDPQYSPWPALAAGQDPTTATYVEPFIVTNVPAATTRVMDLNGGAGLGYSAIALARIDIPANTSSITDLMIKDLRKVAQPRRDRQLRTTALTVNQTDPLTIYSPVGNERWPDVTFSLDVPAWATRARVVANWAGVKIPPGNAWGVVFVLLGYNDPGGDVRTQEVRWDTSGVTQYSTTAIIATDDIAIPANLRDKTVVVELVGRADAGTQAMQPILDWGSAISLDVEFYETAA